MKKPHEHPIVNPLIGPPEVVDPSHEGRLPKQVKDFARTREGGPKYDAAGNLDLSDIELQQGKLRYEISQRTVVETATAYPATGPRHKKPRREATILILNELGSRKREPKQVKKLDTVVDLDVYDEHDNLISKTSHGYKEFLRFLDSHGQQARERANRYVGHFTPKELMPLGRNATLPRGKINHMSWRDPKPKPPAELRGAERQGIQEIKIHVHPGGDVLDQVFRHHERLDLPGGSLLGLTMSRGDHTFQITEDSLVHAPDRGKGEIKIARTWVVTEYNERGQQVKQNKKIYTDGQLRDLLNTTDSNQRRVFRDFRWEIPKDTLRDAHRVAKIGQVAMRADDGKAGTLPEFKWVNDVGSRDISIDDAMLVFHSPDIYDEEEVLERATTPRASHDYDLKFAESLRRAIMQFGTNEVNKVANKLRDDYKRAAGLLGLPLPTEKTSISWALWDIAEQRYYTENHHEAEASRQTDTFGVKVGETLGNSRAARLKQREIVDYEIGLTFSNEVIEGVVVGEPYRHVDDEGTITIKESAIVQFMPDGPVINKVQDFVKPEVSELIARIASAKNEARRPRRADLVHLGRLLQRQVQL